MQIQHMVGGNLAEVLTNLASVVRDRFQMFAKIRATSAEGRLSGVIIGLLPFIVAGALSVLNPGYYGDVRDDALFGPLVGFALLLLFAGQFTIWRMVNFRV
jgi:tight adherence protein B